MIRVELSFYEIAMVPLIISCVVLLWAWKLYRDEEKVYKQLWNHIKILQSKLEEKGSA